MTDQLFPSSTTAKAPALPQSDFLTAGRLSALPGAVFQCLVKVYRGSVEYGLEFLREIPVALRQDAWLMAIVVAYAVVGAWIAVHFEATSILSIGLYFGTYSYILPLSLFLIFVGRILYIALIVRPKHPIAWLATDLRHNLALPRRLAQGLPMLLFTPILAGTFSVFKAAIPLIHPFSWDLRLERWDRWLHGGVAPWEWLQPLLGHPLLSQILNVGYNMWFFLLWFAWLWQFFSLRSPQLRMQFLLSIQAAWIVIGSFLAALLSSAGPCYFGRIVGKPDPYGPLMTYLHQANETHSIWALGTQENLWNGYILGQLNLGAGISAMPSMHIAIATMFALLGWRTSRAMGILLTLFLIWIMVGSVHLGWHYALDGYVSIVCALVLWWISGWFVRRFMRLPMTGSQI
jgi:hypothetical protein